MREKKLHNAVLVNTPLLEKDENVSSPLFCTCTESGDTHHMCTFKNKSTEKNFLSWSNKLFQIFRASARICKKSVIIRTTRLNMFYDQFWNYKVLNAKFVNCIIFVSKYIDGQNVEAPISAE